MNLRFEQLQQHLSGELAPIYLISGDEPLQQQEAADLVRNAAREQGFGEREIFNVEAQFKWDDFIASNQAMSLFASKKVTELRLIKGKPGTDGARALQEFTAQPNPDTLLLVITPKLDKSSQNTKWCKALTDTGMHVQLWPITRQQLPGWIKGRLQRAGLRADSEAITLLADMVDGNLLAAAQEIEKLKQSQSTVDADLNTDADSSTSETSAKIDAETVRQSLTDSSRYSPFSLIDAALNGDSGQCIKIIRNLETEGINANIVVAGLSREIRQLAIMARALAHGQQPNAVMQTHRVWKNRQPLVGKALKRHSVNSLSNLLRLLLRADHMVKGAASGDVWQQLETISLSLAGVSLMEMGLEI